MNTAAGSNSTLRYSSDIVLVALETFARFATGEFLDGSALATRSGRSVSNPTNLQMAGFFVVDYLNSRQQASSGDAQTIKRVEALKESRRSGWLLA
jgi:hypothetical protein